MYTIQYLEQLQQLHHPHRHQFQQMSSTKSPILLDGFHLKMNLQKSKGSYIYDELSDRFILDFYTSFSSCPVGYNHPDLVKQDLRSIYPNKIANSDIITPEYDTFVKTFQTCLPPNLQDHLFFVEGGSAAVENALKAAFDWKIQMLLSNGIRIDENSLQVIHFKQAFHGRGGYTMSLTNTDPIKTDGFPKFDWPRCQVVPALHFKGGLVDNLLDVVEKENAAFEFILNLVKSQTSKQIAALIIEPIQGEGGDNHFRGEFLYRLRKLADKYEFLLIFDEVQTGFGTTGRWWCFEHFNVEPDILVFGKKTQVCGIAASHRLDLVKSVFNVSGRINSTWGGNLIDMVRCTEIISIYEGEKLLERCQKVGARLLKGLIKLEKEGDVISNCRGRGLMIAFDLSSGEERDLMWTKLCTGGVLCLKSGTRTIRLRGPLTLTEDEADLGLVVFEKCFGKNLELSEI